MSELIRDTAFGHLLRYLSGGQLLPYAEDRDPSLWKRYVHDGKTIRMAHHGHTGEEEAAGKSGESQSPEGISRDSSTTRRESNTQTNALGHQIDPEKGRDTNVVDWYGDDDPEVFSAVCHFKLRRADERYRTQ